MQLSKFIIFLCFFCAAAGAKMVGQDFANGPTCPTTQVEYIRHYAEGVALPSNLVINPPPAAGSNFDWSFLVSPTMGGDCGSSFSPPTTNGQTENLGGNLRATFNNNGFNRNVTISSTGNLTAGEYNLTIRVIGGGMTYVKNFRFIVRIPVDIVFALDRSGSMECDTDEDSAADWSGCATSNTAGVPDDRRWNVLASAVDHFVSKLDFLHTLPGDRLSVVYFDGNTSTTGGLTNDAMPFRPVSAFKGAGATTVFKTELDNMNAGGNDLGRNGTSIGAGLVKAIDGRYGGGEDPNRREVVLLFSDGEQNGGNWVKSSGPGTGRIIEQSSSDNTQVLNLDAASVDDIEVLSVSMVSAGTGPALLQAVAKEPGNFFNVLPGQEDRFGSDIAGHAFNEIFNQFSPRFIDQKRMPLAGKPRADFTVNRNVNRLIFEAFYSGRVARGVKAKIYRNGEDVTRLGQRRATDNGLRFIFPLYELPDLPSEAVWTMELMPPGGTAVPPGVEVSIYATADDHAIRFEAGTVEERLIVGDRPAFFK